MFSQINHSQLKLMSFTFEDTIIKIQAIHSILILQGQLRLTKNSYKKNYMLLVCDNIDFQITIYIEKAYLGDVQVRN